MTFYVYYQDGPSVLPGFFQCCSNTYREKNSREQLHKMWNPPYEIFQSSLGTAVLDPQQLGVLLLYVIVL